MHFCSANSNSPPVSFKEAVLNCLPEDGGLYIPGKTIDMRQFFLYMDEETSFTDFMETVAPILFDNELNPLSAAIAAKNVFSFEPALVRLDDDFSILRLDDGPTGFYKDYGINFLAGSIEELQKNNGQSIVLAAVDGNTGISMANAFSGKNNIISVLVYPSGPVYGLDPSCFVSNGGNIIPIQAQGSPKDCRELIYKFLAVRTFAGRHVTSANAVNPGRLLPQILYFLYAFIKIKKFISGGLAFSVYCENFSNLIAGLYAWKFCMPVHGFIAAVNSIVNINSLAVNVNLPSNLNHLAYFYNDAPAVMRNMIYEVPYNEELIFETIRKVWKKYALFIDSCTAAAFAAAEQTLREQNWKGQVHTIILATGHYAKEPDLIFKATGEKISVPKKFQSLKQSFEPMAVIPPDLDSLKNIIAKYL